MSGKRKLTNVWTWAVVGALALRTAGAGAGGGEDAAWRYAPGPCALEEFYAWKGNPLRPRQPDLQARIARLVEKDELLEAYFWATLAAQPQTRTPEFLKPVIDAVLQPMHKWETQAKQTERPQTWGARVTTLAEVFHIPTRPSDDSLAGRHLSAEDRIRLSERLMVASLDAIDLGRIPEVLAFQYSLDPSAERFYRLRAYMLHEGVASRWIAFLQDKGADLPYPEVIEDPIIDDLARRDFNHAFDPLLVLLKQFPDRAERLRPAYRLAFKARLADLIEREEYQGAEEHLMLGESLPYNVLDYDMATYAIYYKLSQAETQNPSATRQALLKFLLNHAVYSEASFVGEALSHRRITGALPATYRAIIETQLGNSGLAFRLLREAAENEPPSAAFFFALGRATEMFKNLWSIAHACYLQSLALDADYEPAILALARHDLLSGRFDEALERTDQVLTKHPDNQAAIYEAARVQYARGDLDKASEGFMRLATSDRAKPEHFHFLIATQLRLRQPDEAQKLIDALIEQYPTDPTAFLMAADVARQKENPKAERKALEKVRDLARPWQFQRVQEARLTRAAVRRLRELGVSDSVIPRVELTSIRRASFGAMPPEETQTYGPWRIPKPKDGAMIVRPPRVPEWISLDETWRDSQRPTVWRELARASADAQRICFSTLQIHNPSTNDMYGVRVFADGEEFAFVNRLKATSVVLLRFRTEGFPRHIGLVFTTESGVTETITPEGSIKRKIEPAYQEPAEP